ncbi:hypothetical protein Syun_023369 [Stephania yunnanensis]|uniref:Uncharacterized protein n=1 Tax=Stephania yunnanensis TaxID=152371 RepID=A0AAP0FGL0_9MAGN
MERRTKRWIHGVYGVALVSPLVLEENGAFQFKTHLTNQLRFATTAEAGVTGGKTARRIVDIEEFEFKIFGENHNQGVGLCGFVECQPPKVVNIAAVFSFDSVIGRSTKTAIKAAIYDINSDPSILKGIRLNTIIKNSKCSVFNGSVEDNGYLLRTDARLTHYENTTWIEADRWAWRHEPKIMSGKGLMASKAWRYGPKSMFGMNNVCELNHHQIFKLCTLSPKVTCPSIQV